MTHLDLYCRWRYIWVFVFCFTVEITNSELIRFYDVINAVPFNGSPETTNGTGCTKDNAVTLTCAPDVITKLVDNNTGPVNSVLDDLGSFFAFSRQTESDSSLVFILSEPTNGIARVVLHFFNSPAQRIGLPTLSLTTLGDAPVPFGFTDNSDLSQTDSTIMNVTLLAALSEPFLRITITFSQQTSINWFLLSEVDITSRDGFPTIVFQDSPSTVIFNISLDSNVSISCEVINPGTFEWKWKNNNGDLVDGGRYNILTSSDTQTSTLTVLNPMTNDTGDYTCIVNSTSERTIELMEDQGLMSSSVSNSVISTTTTAQIVTNTQTPISKTQTPSSSTIPQPTSSPSILPVAIGATVAIIVILVIAIAIVLILIFVCARRKRKMISDLRSVKDQSQSQNTELRDSSANEKQKGTEMIYSAVIKDKPPTIPPQNFNETDLAENNKQKREPSISPPPKLAKLTKAVGLDLVDNPLYNDSAPNVQTSNDPYYSSADNPSVPEAMYSEVTKETPIVEATYSTPEYFDLKNPIYDEAGNYNEIQPFSFVSSETYSDGPIYSVPEIGTKKSDTILKITPDHLQEIKHLGVGQFGEVVLAKTIGLSLMDLGLNENEDDRNISLNVAVKKVKVDAQDASMISFEKEMKFMSQLKHDNVVQLLAVSEDDCEPFMVMEFMENGDLNQFLLWHQLVESHPPKQREHLSYQNLLSMSIQVASGLSYLASHNYIHRDVATRNCLVGDNDVVKIADFGLSRSLYDSVYYRVKGKAKMPIRWMATECFYGKFSQFSDVWAYGVTVWEIYTMGREPPYPTIDDETILDDALKGEDRILLSKPLLCPQEIYDIICSSCFVADYRKRDTFSEICKKLLLVEKQIYD